MDIRSAAEPAGSMPASRSACAWARRADSPAKPACRAQAFFSGGLARDTLIHTSSLDLDRYRLLNLDLVPNTRSAPTGSSWQYISGRRFWSGVAWAPYTRSAPWDSRL